MRVAVVLPAHNEQGNLTPLVTELLRVGQDNAIDIHVVVVNDGSTDGTAQELESLCRAFDRVRVVTHPVNRGFAAALRTGIAAACAGDAAPGWDRGCEAAAFMDADLSHRPDDLPKLVAALDAGGDVAIGSRFVPGGGMVGVPAWRVAISRCGNLFGRVVLGVRVRDLTTGYRLVRRAVFDRIQLVEDGFTIQLESVIKAYAAGFRVVEAPITLSTRLHGTSHMFYSPSLFARYWRLLWKCRRWLRETGTPGTR